MKPTFLTIRATTKAIVLTSDTMIISGAAGTSNITTFTSHRATMTIRTHAISSVAKVMSLWHAMGFQKLCAENNGGGFHQMALFF
jgi:hypothetical protein